MTKLFNRVRFAIAQFIAPVPTVIFIKQPAPPTDAQIATMVAFNYEDEDDSDLDDSDLVVRLFRDDTVEPMDLRYPKDEYDIVVRNSTL